MVFRAIETRTPVVRVTTTGISAVIGPDGSLLARLGAGESGVLEADVPVRDGPPTPYVQVGDALAISCVLVLLLAVVRECWSRAQANSRGRTKSSRNSA